MALRKALAEEASTLRPHHPLPPPAPPSSRSSPPGGAVGGHHLADPVPAGLRHPQPHKRPHSSWKRFCAELPNECWQADTTHWRLADGTEVEILNVLDDHSRLLVASRAFVTTKAADVVETFHRAAARWGLLASMLTDNGAIFTAESRNGRCAMETELARLGVAYKHSRPYHPQTCGKVERFHQTLKKLLAKQRRPTTVVQLQAQLDRFAAYYNSVRPHRALGRRTPAEAFAARTKATPKEPIAVEGHHRVRRDRVDRGGRVTLRYCSKLLHIGIGRAHAGTRVLLLVNDRDVRVITEALSPGSGAEEPGQGGSEVAAAHPVQYISGSTSTTFGALAGPRRQDRGSEPAPIPGVVDAAVVDPRCLHVDPTGGVVMVRGSACPLRTTSRPPRWSRSSARPAM